jgi:crotonobetainyl-CoA:carnitine CoA-transferase CaiB-like acyl-CoA transferase
MFAGAHLVQGILACLVRRGISGKGGLVQVSLLESILDTQFEVLTTHLNDGGRLPQRSAVNNGNAYLAAPYGIYASADGYIALAMNSITVLGQLLDCPALLNYPDRKSWFTQRDEIKQILADHLRTQSSAHWLGILEPNDIWCAEVLNWSRLLAHGGFQALQMVQTVERTETIHLDTLRCPIRIDGEILFANKGAPRLGEDTQGVIDEFGL